MSKETTFQQDTIDMDFLKRTLASMVDKLAFDLRREQKLTGCLTLKIRYSNFDTHNRQVKVPYTNYETAITDNVMTVFRDLYSHRMLSRRIGVRLSTLLTCSYKVDLLKDTRELISIQVVMA